MCTLFCVFSCVAGLIVGMVLGVWCGRVDTSHYPCFRRGEGAPAPLGRFLTDVSSPALLVLSRAFLFAMTDPVCVSSWVGFLCFLSVSACWRGRERGC